MPGTGVPLYLRLINFPEIRKTSITKLLQIFFFANHLHIKKTKKTVKLVMAQARRLKI
jgi:hypothetical protein